MAPRRCCRRGTRRGLRDRCRCSSLRRVRRAWPRKASEMSLRKISPRTTCLYWVASILLRRASAALKSCFLKPRSVPLPPATVDGVDVVAVDARCLPMTYSRRPAAPHGNVREVWAARAGYSPEGRYANQVKGRRSCRVRLRRVHEHECRRGGPVVPTPGEPVCPGGWSGLCRRPGHRLCSSNAEQPRQIVCAWAIKPSAAKEKVSGAEQPSRSPRRRAPSLLSRRRSSLCPGSTV